MSNAARLPVVERAIAAVSPRWGATRARHRTLLQAHRIQELEFRAFEGASRSNRMSGWLTGATSANAEIATGLSTLRNRHRDLVRNNPIASRAAALIPSNMGHLTAGFKGKNADLADTLWKRWALTSACDSDEQLTFPGLQSLAMRGNVESGEILCRRRYRRNGDGLPVPLQLQMLEADFLADEQTSLKKTNLVQGIEFDGLGRRSRYHLYRTHPGDGGFGAIKTTKVKARDIHHIFRVDRPGQVRGVPWGAPIIVRLRDFDEYEDAQIMRQKIAACFAGFIYDADGEGKTKSSTVGDKVSPGSLVHLGSGEQIAFAKPPGVDGYGEVSSQLLHSIATGYGVPFESLTSNYSQVSFTSGRMGYLEFHLSINMWRQQLLVPFCNRVWHWFVEAASLEGYDLSEVEVTWTAPRREMLDPVKEVRAMKEAKKEGFLPLPDIHRSLTGRPSSDVVDDIKDSNEALEKAGLGGLKVGVPVEAGKSSKDG